MELTKDEIKNGWTPESLAKYQKEREKANAQSILEPKTVRPSSQKGYNPLRWRN